MLAILTRKHSLIAWYLQPGMGDNVIFHSSGKERDSEETCRSPCCAGKAPRGSQDIKSTGLQDHSLMLAGKKKKSIAYFKIIRFYSNPYSIQKRLRFPSELAVVL